MVLTVEDTLRVNWLVTAELKARSAQRRSLRSGAARSWWRCGFAPCGAARAATPRKQDRASKWSGRPRPYTGRTTREVSWRQWEPLSPTRVWRGPGAAVRNMAAGQARIPYLDPGQGPGGRALGCTYGPGCFPGMWETGARLEITGPVRAPGSSQSQGAPARSRALCLGRDNQARAEKPEAGL